MISVLCITVLALASQIRASGCGQSVVLPSGSSSPVVLISPRDSDFSPVNRNIIARGKYPVALSNCDLTPNQQIPVITSRVITPVQEKPTVHLPSAIPAPKTISHSCTCYKTILTPRVHQQIITVPTVQRYVETSHKPVVENIQYEALPVNCERPGCSFGSGIQLVKVGAGSTSGMVSGCSCGCRAHNTNVPFVQVQAVPSSQILLTPRIHC